MSTQQATKSIIPLYDGMNKIPGGAMVICRRSNLI